MKNYQQIFEDAKNHNNVLKQVNKDVIRFDNNTLNLNEESAINERINRKNDFKDFIEDDCENDPWK